MKDDMGYFESGGEMRTLTFFYRNWRGEHSYRTVKGVPVMWYGSTEYHKEPQWFMKAYDTEKDAIRDFAVSDILEFLKGEQK